MVNVNFPTGAAQGAPVQPFPDISPQVSQAAQASGAAAPGTQGAAFGGSEEAPPPTHAASQPKLTREEAEGELEKFRQAVSRMTHRLDFGLFGDSNELFVRVVDRANNDVVQVMPPEKLLELHAKLNEAFGMLIDEQA